MYGSDAERQAARKKDTDQRWWEVRDEWIESFSGIGGLSFLDEAGFRYYLPAYMSYFLRKREEPNSLTFHLCKDRRNYDALFSTGQNATIGRFLDFVCHDLREECLAPEVFDEGWASYRNSDRKT
jgi:hypothetical protein